jgi:hypothetical protein
MLCVRLSFISLSFVFTPFDFAGIKWKAMRSLRHPNVGKASKSETQFMYTMGQVQGRERIGQWHTLAPSLGMMN